MYVLFFRWLMWLERRKARRDVVTAAKRAVAGWVPDAVVLQYNPDDLRAVHDAVKRLHEFGG